MIKVVGIQFDNSNKIYYFDPSNVENEISDASFLIVETERGEQFGKLATNIIMVDENKLSSTLKPVLRVATSSDEITHKKNLKDAIKAIEDANRFVEELSLDMRILDASFTFDRKQLLFQFLADDRIDFRILAKKLAAIYRTRIELRQIGVRDKAKEVGGCGQCGRNLCCSTFLKDLNSVSINMAKHQNLALNPQKINGVCGRLMCCLAYEDDLYKEYKKGLPKINEIIETESGTGKVLSVDIFERSYVVQMDNGSIVEMR